MNDERLQEIFESTSADVPDAHLIFGRAVAQAERERCALVCEAFAQNPIYGYVPVETISAAIRLPLPTATGGNV